jgi:acyl-[acyl-carrier-protein] desaturase
MSQSTTNFELEKNLEVISQLDDFVGNAVDTVLVQPEECWQPSDFLPDLGKEDALDQIKILQQRTSGIPDTVFTSLIGNMITEEALAKLPNLF